MNQEEKSKVAAFIGQSIMKYHKMVKISLHPTEKLKLGNIESTGWADKNELRVATGGDMPLWLGVFVHETCHLDQNAANPEWVEECERALGLIDEWLGGTNYSKSRISNSIGKIVELEWDCEKRSIAKIKKYGLPINIDEYCQMANAYILGYYWTLKNRKWCKKSYNNSKIWSLMPKRLIPQTYAILPPLELLTIFNEH